MLFLGFCLHLYTYICIKIVNGLSLPRKLSCVHCCYCILFDFIYSPIHQSTKAHLKLFFNVNYPVPPPPPWFGTNDNLVFPFVVCMCLHFFFIDNKWFYTTVSCFQIKLHFLYQLSCCIQARQTHLQHTIRYKYR